MYIYLGSRYKQVMLWRNIAIRMNLLLLLSCLVVSDSVRPHRWQPTRLPRPWDSPGKNTGVGCQFPSPMHESEKWKWSHSVVSGSLQPMDCSLPGFSILGIFQARVLEWGAIAFSRMNLLPLFRSEELESRNAQAHMALGVTPSWELRSPLVLTVGTLFIKSVSTEHNGEFREVSWKHEP